MPVNEPPGATTLLDLLLNEDLWFPTATAIALVAVMVLVFKQRRLNISRMIKVMCSLNLFYGLVIGIMGVGHLLAVTIKTVLGTLPPSTNGWFVFPLGLALAIPGWWLVTTVGGLTRNEKRTRLKAVALNVWLGIVLLVPALPLVLPAALNVLVLTRKRPDYDATTPARSDRPCEDLERSLSREGINRL